jgi:hypothetical protein
LSKVDPGTPFEIKICSMTTSKEKRKPPALLTSKSLEILCQATLKHFPFGAGHGNTNEAWQLVCKDFEEAHKGKNAITAQTAKNKINHLLAEWVKLNKEDH